jgi:hypothetical protein
VTRATLSTLDQPTGTGAKASPAAARVTTDSGPGFLTAAHVCDALAVPSKCPLAYCARLARDGEIVRVMRGVYLASSVEQFKKRLAEAALLAARSRGGKQ